MAKGTGTNNKGGVKGAKKKKAKKDSEKGDYTKGRAGSL